MGASESGNLFGSILMNLIWLFLIIYPLFKSIRRKQTTWVVLLIVNFVISFALPTYISFILPIIYLISFKGYEEKAIAKHKNKKRKRK